MAYKKASKKSYPRSYYGKRPLWQWILIYLIIGGVVYAVVYYFIIAKNNMSYSTSPITNTNTPTYNLPTY